MSDTKKKTVKITESELVDLIDNIVTEAVGEKKKEWEDLNKRYELTRHSLWAVETPNGLTAVVLHEGPGADTFMQKVAVSDHSFDKLMTEKIMEFHGMDLGAPPPGPMPVELI